MKNTWFTSDTHFRHTKIIEYCNRPFENVTDMDMEMVERWNERVKPSDTIYHLGDFCMGRNKEVIDMFMESLNGRKILVYGNHDSPYVRNHKEWAESHQYLEIKDRSKNLWLILFHYPIASWNGSFHGSINLHGHCHGSFTPGMWADGSPKKCLDVGVDSHDFRPWSYEEILEEINNR